MTYAYELVGDARTRIAAVGPGDAEHQVEKLIRSRCAECTVYVVEIRRLGRELRIADEFEIALRIGLAGEVDAGSSAAARREVLRSARRRFADTAVRAVVWGEPKLREAERSDG